ncbi:MAG: glycosyltransferase [Fimbriimonadaceae bacterium]|nr:glycosyltransferase [Fimbriimonadaceae bacterium]
MMTLAEQYGIEVVWAVESDNGKDRSEMGWPDCPGGSAQLVLAPDSKRINEILSIDPDRSLHLFGGIFFNPTVRKAFFKAVFKPLKLALMTEAPLPAGFEESGAKSKASKLKKFLPIAHMLTRLLFGRKIIAIFCIGAMCADFYKKVGYEDEKLIPWAYYPPNPTSVPAINPDDGIVQLTYLGAMNHRKGTDLLMKALTPLKGLNWHLNCIGDGTLAKECRDIVQKGDIGHQVTIQGYLPWEQAMDLLAISDIALVPSRHDGWGAVVSEALMRGVPAIATDHCGSADLLGQPWRGAVVKANDVDALTLALRNCIAKGKLTSAERTRIADWSVKCQASTGVDYFISTLKYFELGGQKPSAPWHDKTGTG